MAGVTTALMAAGMAANAIQIADAQKKKQESEFEAKNQAAKLAQVQETDYMAAMQVPTLAYDLASQAAMARSAEAINALQGAGTEAVLGGVPSVVQEGMQQDLQIAGALGEAQYQNELMKAQAKQGIESRRVAREQDIAESRLQGAQLGAFSATQNRNQAVGGMIDLAAQGATMYDANQSLYKPQPGETPSIGVSSTGSAMINNVTTPGLTATPSTMIQPTIGQPSLQVPKFTAPQGVNPQGIVSPNLNGYQLESIYGLPMGTFSSFKGQ
jgi:hypothetical protein